VPIDGNDQELRQLQRVSEERAEERTDEAERDGDEKPAARSTPDRSTEGSADTCDNQQHE
jgi:hypothetical protein